MLKANPKSAPAKPTAVQTAAKTVVKSAERAQAAVKTPVKSNVAAQAAAATTQKKAPPTPAKPAVTKNAAPAKNNSILEELELLSGEWDNAEVMEFGDVPEGKYQVLIESININNSKSSGRLQVSWGFTIQSGQFANRKIFKHDGLDDPSKLGFLRTALHRLGVEWPAKSTDLPEVLAGIEGSFAEVTVKVKGEFTNCYINKALDPAEVGAADLEEAPTDEATEEVVEETIEEAVEDAPAEEEAPAAEEEATVEEEAPAEEEPSLTIKTLKVLLPGQVKEMLTLSKTAAFTGGDPKKPLDYLVQLGLYCGLTGEFNTPTEVLGQIKAMLT